MSQRQAAAVLGVDEKTVRNDLRPPPAEFSAGGQESEPEAEFEPPFPQVEDDPAWAEPKFKEEPAENSAPTPEPVQNSTPEPEPEPEDVPESKPHVARNGGNNEWYTPAEYVKAASAVMGGIVWPDLLWCTNCGRSNVPRIASQDHLDIRSAFRTAEGSREAGRRKPASVAPGASWPCSGTGS